MAKFSKTGRHAFIAAGRPVLTFLPADPASMVRSKQVDRFIIAIEAERTPRTNEARHAVLAVERKEAVEIVAKIARHLTGETETNPAALRALADMMEQGRA